MERRACINPRNSLQQRGKTSHIAVGTGGALVVPKWHGVLLSARDWVEFPAGVAQNKHLALG